MVPVYYNSHSIESDTDTNWDRRYLAPYNRRTLRFTGVPIEHINYGPKLMQVIVASIYSCNQPKIEIDHVCMIIKKTHLNQFPLFEPITFNAQVHRYNTMAYIKVDDIKHKVPISVDNYTLVDPRHIHTDNQFQIKHQTLSMYLRNRIEMLKRQTDYDIATITNNINELDNDGRREESITPYVNSVKRTVNRITIHRKLH